MNIFSSKFINIGINNVNKKEIEQIEEVITKEEKIQPEELEQQPKTEEVKEKEYDWYIEIKPINLKAPVAETTEMKVLNEFVGHFEETALTVGNIGLAGHNRGYENNYFEDLKNVKLDDEIKYVYKDYKKTYIVDTIEIIRNTDWSYLENTEKNKITLITCTENEPEFRLCVQATEKNDSI